MGRGGEGFICDRERKRERIGVGMVWYGDWRHRRGCVAHNMKILPISVICLYLNARSQF